jgi:hypothetical protein
MDMCLIPLSADNSSASLAKKRESRRDSRFMKLGASGKDMDVERTAEEWRKRPVFDKDEVTMSLLGALIA